MDVLSQMLEHKIVAIIRGAKSQDVMHLADALYRGGIKLLEVTMNSEKPLEVISLLAEVFEGKLLIGAGTVLDGSTAKSAIDAGAKFIISPAVDAETIRATRDKGAISVPGAYTATEILLAHKSGGQIIKVFPASSPAYIKDLRGPLSNILLMPTGGVNLENIRAFQLAGGVAFGIGGALVDSRPVTGEYLEQLTEKAKLFVNSIANTQRL